MELPLLMNDQELFKTKLEAESFNKSLAKNGRKVENTLGKDDFLRLLVVQLKHQDPTNPLDDKEFIAQMAQFSSLEQLTEMNKTMNSLIDGYKVNLSYSMLGRQVEVFDEATGKVNSGLVTAIQFGSGVPTISFNGLSYSVDDVTKISLGEVEKK